MYKWILISIIIVIIDLVLKYWISAHFEYGQGLEVLNNFISIRNIKTVRMTYGLVTNNSFHPLITLTILLELLFLFLFIRLQRINIGRLYKISTLFIFFGIIGNYIDKFLFSKGENGYVQMDYLSINYFSSFFNLSSLLYYIGWVSLIIAIIKNFKDLKKIFSRGVKQEL